MSPLQCFYKLNIFLHKYRLNAYTIVHLLATGCNDTTGDIVFVLDASGSIEEHNFVRVVQFVGAVVHSLTIRSDQSPDGFQVALVSFSDGVDIRFYLDTYTDKELMLAAINIPYMRGRTNLVQALRYLSSLSQRLTFYRVSDEQESHAIAGRTARCRCKFRHVSIILQRHRATARLSCIHQRPLNKCLYYTQYADFFGRDAKSRL